jgi:hypothetical protein
MSFYGDNINRFFFGQVVNNNDAELNLGRVQIRVYGIHEGIESYDLPWAQVMIPTTEPGIGGIGSSPLLANGAQVFGVFLDGKDSQIPFVLGSVPKIMIPSQSRRSTFVGDTIAPRYVTESGSSTSVVVPIGSLEGSTNAERVYRFFVNNGFTPEQSAGIVGNFAVESTTNIDPTLLNPNDKGKQSFGIAQWRDTRYNDLQNWARETGQDYTTLETQLGFVLYEFSTTERSAASNIKATTSTAEAARVVDRYYERSDGTAREIRVQYALEAFERFR